MPATAIDWLAPRIYKVVPPALPRIPLAKVRLLSTKKYPLAPIVSVLPPSVTPFKIPAEPFSRVPSVLTTVPFLRVPELIAVSPPVPNVAAPMSSVPPPRSTVPVRLKMPPVRTILPLMSATGIAVALVLPLPLPRLNTPPVCAMVPALLNVVGRTSSVPAEALIVPPALLVKLVFWM